MRRPLKMLSPVLVGALLAVVGVTTAGAGHETTVTSYTGCLKNGKLESVQPGGSPTSRCVKPAVEVHVSAGDITAVLTGVGLEGGSVNGSATLGIAPGYRLPQGCAIGQVAELTGPDTWACADDDGGTYTAGTGLDLIGDELSIRRLFQLPQDCAPGESPEYVRIGTTSVYDWACNPKADAGQSCPTGEFATGLATNGSLTCGAGAGGGGGLAVYSGQQANPVGEGVPDDRQLREYGAVDVPAGTYLVALNAVMDKAGDFDEFSALHCTLFSGSTRLVPWQVLGPEDGDLSVSLTAVTSTSGGRLSFRCMADYGADGAGVQEAAIHAVRLG